MPQKPATPCDRTKLTAEAVAEPSATPTTTDTAQPASYPLHAFQTVRSDKYASTDRLRVQSGWLYRVLSVNQAVALAFVPDGDATTEPV